MDEEESSARQPSFKRRSLTHAAKIAANALSIFVWLPIVVLYLLSWPFLFVYRKILCCLAWWQLAPNEKLIVVVHDQRKDTNWYLSRILDSTGGRVHLLDFAEQKSWRKWSLPVRLFWQFGPIPWPPMFTPRYLPAVVVVKRFSAPRKYSFGSMSKEREAQWDKLRADLQG